MITKTFICDLKGCNESVGEENLYKLTLTVERPATKENRYRSHVAVEKHVCKNCLAAKGMLLEPTEGNTEIGINRKTIEDKLVDILEELGVAFCE